MMLNGEKINITYKLVKFFYLSPLKKFSDLNEREEKELLNQMQKR